MVKLNPERAHTQFPGVRRGDEGLEDVLTKLCNMRFPEALVSSFMFCLCFFCVKLSLGLFCFEFGNSEVKWNFSGGCG